MLDGILAEARTLVLVLVLGGCKGIKGLEIRI